MKRMYLLLFVCLFLSACQATVQEKDIVKHIARIHNARIKLESQVDVGTTITVTFPTAS